MYQQLPPQLINAVVELRRMGYAVCLFSPEELDGCPADDLEGYLVEQAWLAIHHAKEQIAKEA